MSIESSGDGGEPCQSPSRGFSLHSFVEAVLVHQGQWFCALEIEEKGLCAPGIWKRLTVFARLGALPLYSGVGVKIFYLYTFIGILKSF